MNLSIHPRKLARSIARHELERHGYRGFNKPRFTPDGKRAPSNFAANWRTLAARRG